MSVTFCAIPARFHFPSVFWFLSFLFGQPTLKKILSGNHAGLSSSSSKSKPWPSWAFLLCLLFSLLCVCVWIFLFFVFCCGMSGGRFAVDKGKGRFCVFCAVLVLVGGGRQEGNQDKREIIEKRTLFASLAPLCRGSSRLPLLDLALLQSERRVCCSSCAASSNFPALKTEEKSKRETKRHPEREKKSRDIVT